MTQVLDEDCGAAVGETMSSMATSADAALAVPTLPLLGLSWAVPAAHDAAHFMLMAGAAAALLLVVGFGVRWYLRLPRRSGGSANKQKQG